MAVALRGLSHSAIDTIKAAQALLRMNLGSGRASTQASPRLPQLVQPLSPS